MERITAIEHALYHLYERIIAMNAQVVAVVSQVASNVAADASASKAIAKLIVDVADLKTQLASASANGFTAEDTAALTKAVSDLSTSATALAAATPA